jgi:hypothetical protein
MNIKEFANLLHGRSYGREITSMEEKKAKELGFVVVFGYSDDNVEFRGAIEDEVGCYNSREILFDKDGILEECECECKYWEKAKEKATQLKAVWHDDSREGYCWTYEIDIPHETFDIIEDSEWYCRGIVFDIKELQ